MHLYLMRHGIAISHDDPDCPAENDRFLIDEGIEKTKLAALGLIQLGLSPRVLVSSPLVRAMQTAEIVADALNSPRDKIHQSTALLPDSPPEDIFHLLREIDRNEVLCFGHGPNLDLILALTLGSPEPPAFLKKAGMAWIELDSIVPPCGRLRGLFSNKALRLMAG